MERDKGDDDTLELLIPPILPATLWPDTGSSRVEVDLAAVSDPGLRRKSNEDHYLVLRFGRTLETLFTNLGPDHHPGRAEEVGYGLVVADGMGGAPGGGVASQMAITTLVSLALHTPDWILGLRPKDLERSVERMATRWRDVHEALRERGDRDPNLAHMGTTMSAAVSLGPRLVVGHVGDSRIYIFRAGELHQLTRDHTLVQTLVDLGQLKPEQAANHPRRHVLMQSLNAASGICQSDFLQEELQDGDQLLLCTDGLTDMVDRNVIRSVLGEAVSAHQACQTLLAAALKNGGKDNVTVALARYKIPPSSSTTPRQSR